ncbi:hypothetical protein NW768_011163 [Fusarium equiseti]|uniref:CHAT domain-containing protein n=1 Tax=Fusarium equiseti TaxID=61235 RepID=A0ABQ8QZ64_FUSEQ|nr:hypothetical protein NW768_011163 [Fusarium equiseti]
MAEGGGNSPSGRSDVCRTFIRSDEIRVVESSPREPYLSFTIGPHPLRRLIIKIWSHDQGWCNPEFKTDQPYANSHTWFALGIVPEHANSPQSSQGSYLCEIQRNVRASIQTKCHVLEWRLNTPFEGDQSDANEAQGWLESISSGSSFSVGVFPRARYPGWVNVVYQVKVELYDDANRGLLSEMNPAAGEVRRKMIHDYEKAMSQMISVTKRYEQTRSIEDLTRAIEATQLAIGTMPINHPELAACLSNLGIWLSTRFEATGSMDDMERAIEVIQGAIDSTPEADHKSLVTYLGNLGTCLGIKAEHRDSTDDLKRAIEVTERAIAITSDNDPGFAAVNNNLAKLLSRMPDQDSLTRAIEASQKAVKATGFDDFHLAICLGTLSQALARRFEQTGSVDDLTKAIEASQRAVESASIRHPNLSSLFSNLSSCLGRRYEMIGSVDDLIRAIEAAEKAVQTTRHGDITLAGKLSNLGILLARQHKRTRSLHDLARAIRVSEQAVEASDHAHLALCFSNLGNRLSERYQQTESLDDLLRAIKEAEKAVEAAHGDRNAANYLMNLGNRIIELYNQSGSAVDLTRAIEVAQKAVEVAHHEHIYLSMYLRNLGDKLGRRYEQTGLKADQDAQLSAYVRSWHAMSSLPSDRIRSVRPAAAIYVSRAEWGKAYELLREAILLLPNLSPRSLKQSDMQEMLSPTSGLATDAAAMAFNAGKPASEVLSILELGRGVIAGLLIDTRGDLSDLRKACPLLADRFEALREELDSPLQNSGSMAELSTINRRHEASREFDEVIERIRAKDGFTNFLQPPPAESLMAAAQAGPLVVINVSAYRCDAILVENHRIRLLEIPAFKFEDIVNISGSKHDPWPLLAWLWTTVCKSCLDGLGFTEPVGDGQWPHVWWVPTGLLSQLPLHAAGIYATSCPKETVLDRVVSSYASSIKALQHARQRRGVIPDEQGKQNDAVLVAMEETTGQMSLPNARTEIDKVRELCPLLNLKATTPPRRKADILKHLRKCTVLHFAGHGESSRDPSQSRLLLDDWKTDPLTVGDLRESWLQESPAFLAYLSACSTGSNKGSGLSDEAIHLVSAFQLAGFRHVVGTLWEVSDPHCVDVATVMYQTLCDEGMTDEAVSHGLHRAVRKLRDDSFREGGNRDIVLVEEDEGEASVSNVNTFWIPYIHFGA